MAITEITPTVRVYPLATARRSTIAAPSPTKICKIELGQLWLIEHSAVAGASSEPVRRALADANVVIYDRALVEAVAAVLPVGGYAEPAAAEGEADDPVPARAVRFAADGWSVARLLPARPTQRERIARVRRLVEELTAARSPSDTPVTVLGELADGVCETTETRLDRLDLVVVTYPREAPLTIVVESVGQGSAARLHGVAANGPAG